MFGGRPSDPRYRVVRLSGEEHRILIAGSGIPVVIPFQGTGLPLIETTKNPILLYCKRFLHCKAQGRWAFARGWLFVCGLAANVCLGVVLYLLCHIILWEL